MGAWPLQIKFRKDAWDQTIPDRWETSVWRHGISFWSSGTVLGLCSYAYIGMPTMQCGKQLLEEYLFLKIYCLGTDYYPITPLIFPIKLSHNSILDKEHRTKRKQRGKEKGTTLFLICLIWIGSRRKSVPSCWHTNQCPQDLKKTSLLFLQMLSLIPEMIRECHCDFPVRPEVRDKLSFSAWTHC